MLQLYALSVIFYYRTSQASPPGTARFDLLLDLPLKVTDLNHGGVFDGSTKVEKSRVL